MADDPLAMTEDEFSSLMDKIRTIDVLSDKERRFVEAALAASTQQSSPDDVTGHYFMKVP